MQVAEHRVAATARVEAFEALPLGEVHRDLVCRVLQRGHARIGCPWWGRGINPRVLKAQRHYMECRSNEVCDRGGVMPFVSPGYRRYESDAPNAGSRLAKACRDDRRVESAGQLHKNGLIYFGQAFHNRRHRVTYMQSGLVSGENAGGRVDECPRAPSDLIGSLRSLYT